MDNAIEPTIGNWYHRVGEGETFQVVAVDDEEALVEFQHFDGDIEEISLNEWRTWDLEVIAAPEDWTGPFDEIQRSDLGYSEIRSEGERRRLSQERQREALQVSEIPGSEGSVSGRRPNEEAGGPEVAGGAEAERETHSERRADGLNRRQINQIKTRLTQRTQELRLDIQRELEKYDDESYTELAQRVSDSGEESWRDLLSDVNLAEITRDVGEVRDIEAAFERLAEGHYGSCVTCGDRIGPKRLEANPAAVRCLECQHAWETRDGEDHYHTL